MKRSLLALLAATALATTPAMAIDQGVTDDEILIGNNTDLSGVAAVLGVQNANGWRMAFDEANEAGGIHGRKIRLIVEDHQYQVPKAVQAANKLINLDKVFTTAGNGGTPTTLAMMPMLKEKGIPNVFAFSGTRQLYDPYDRLTFAHFASFYDQMRAATKYFNDKGAKTFCAMYNDTDLGHEVMDGVRDQLKAMGKELASESAHKPTDTDFSAVIAKHQDAGCDILLLGTIIRDTNQIIAQARKVGWDVEMVGPSSTYDASVASVPGQVNNGYYAMTPFIYAYPDDPREEVREFTKNFNERFGVDPTFAAQVGYAGGQMVVMGLENAGRELTVDSFVKGLEGIQNHRDIFGSPPMSFVDGDHHGATDAFITQVKDGKWTKLQEEAVTY